MIFNQINHHGSVFVVDHLCVSLSVLIGHSGDNKRSSEIYLNFNLKKNVQYYNTDIYR